VRITTIKTPNWLKPTIKSMLKTLLGSRLKWRPQPAEIQDTADSWEKVFIAGQHAIHDSDQARIMSGFTALLAAELKEWPTPWQIINKMPKRPQQQQLDWQKPVSDAKYDKDLKKLRVIMGGLIEDTGTDGNRHNERQRAQGNERAKK
jgi:hypothetical protein